MKCWEVYKEKEIPDEGDPEEREEKEQNLEQEHRGKRVNSLFLCVRSTSSGKLVISLLYTQTLIYSHSGHILVLELSPSFCLIHSLTNIYWFGPNWATQTSLL